jgi:hypothetical protein
MAGCLREIARASHPTLERHTEKPASGGLRGATPPIAWTSQIGVLMAPLSPNVTQLKVRRFHHP